MRETIDPGEQIDIARDERTFRDDHDAQTRMLREYLENSACNPESSLGRLIRICGSADHDRLALKQLEVAIASEPERATQNLRRVPLDENIPLEGEPWRQPVVCLAEYVGHFLVGSCPLHDVAMGVAGVAIGAAERAADVRIDGPESHAGGLGP